MRGRPTRRIGKGPKRPPDTWCVASLSDAECHRITLPTIKQSGLAINAFMSDTAHAAMTAVGWSPQALANRSLAHRLVRMWLFYRAEEMRTCEFSATPMASGLRCQATVSQFSTGRSSARMRCKWVSGLRGLVVNYRLAAQNLVLAIPTADRVTSRLGKARGVMVIRCVEFQHGEKSVLKPATPPD